MATPDFEHATLLRSYQYLRIAMVLAVLALFVAVGHQSWGQKDILPSISAYYYTPAHGIFVGVLMAMGMAMLVIRGVKDEEDTLLNVAGLLAPVVALVPTARNEDFRAVRDACDRGELPVRDQDPAKPLDCTEVAELLAEAEANATNNMGALLVVGVVGLVLAWVLATRARRTRPFKIGFGVVAAVYALGLLAFVVARRPFIEYAHYPAAIAMFACIIGVALVNAMRRQGTEVKGVPRFRDKVGRVAGSLIRPQDSYAYIALAMLVIAAGGVVLKLLDVFEETIFWTELLLIALFAAFWSLQTKEHWDGDGHEPGPG